MSDKLAKLTSIVSIVLFVLAILFGGLFYFNVMSMEAMPDSIVVPSEKVAWTMERLGGPLEYFVYIVYVLVFLSLFSTIGFSILNIFKSTKTAKNSLLSIGVLGGIFLIAYAFSSPEIPVFLGVEKFNLTPGIAMTVDTGLISMYLFFIIAVGGIVFTGVRSLFR